MISKEYAKKMLEELCIYEAMKEAYRLAEEDPENPDLREKIDNIFAEKASSMILAKDLDSTHIVKMTTGIPSFYLLTIVKMLESQVVVIYNGEDFLTKVTEWNGDDWKD